MGGPDSKISTVDVESGDNMATLPVSRAHTSSTDTAEKNNAANKEMELKNVMPKPLERYYCHWQNSESPLLFIFDGFESEPNHFSFRRFGFSVHDLGNEKGDISYHSFFLFSLLFIERQYFVFFYINLVKLTLLVRLTSVLRALNLV